mmetsp:Transcript_23205/g.46566  ORF Transcript_23205/g.46566 Transcript_23205/m.46566 type:complete len:169 (+) Transcript_23205:2-508(+)
MNTPRSSRDPKRSSIRGTSLVDGRRNLSCFWLVLGCLIVLMRFVSSFVSSTTGKHDTLPEYEDTSGDPHFAKMDAYDRHWRLATSLGGTPLKDAVYKAAYLQGERDRQRRGYVRTNKRSLAKSVARRIGKLLHRDGGNEQNNVLREIHNEALRSMEQSAIAKYEGAKQ